MIKRLFLFDVDGTITNSGEKMFPHHITTLNLIKIQDDIGIVGGGKFEKILEQTSGVKFDYYFSECGSVYHDHNLNLIYKKNIRNHSLYPIINILIKKTLNYLSQVDYELTGNFIDLRNGLIYISLIGLSADPSEREHFINIDKINNYRMKLLDILHQSAIELEVSDKLSIVIGGSVGIAIYPEENDKLQVLSYINSDKYSEIHYFGDKYLPDGNDYHLLNAPNIIGHKIDHVDETFFICFLFINTS